MDILGASPTTTPTATPSLAAAVIGAATGTADTATDTAEGDSNLGNTGVGVVIFVPGAILLPSSMDLNVLKFAGHPAQRMLTGQLGVAFTDVDVEHTD